MAQSEHIAVALYLRGKSPDSPRVTADVYRVLSGTESNHVDTEIIDVDHVPWRLATDGVSEVPAVVVRRGGERFVLAGAAIGDLPDHFARLGLSGASPPRIEERPLAAVLESIERAIVTLSSVLEAHGPGAGDLYDSVAYLADCLRQHKSALRDSVESRLTDIRGASAALAVLFGGNSKDDDMAAAVSYLARNLKHHCQEARCALAGSAIPAGSAVTPDSRADEPLLSMQPAARKASLAALSARFTVGDVLAAKQNPQIVAVKRSSLLPGAADILARNRMAILPVVDDQNRFTGILSERDILGAFARAGAGAAAMTVGDVATRTVHACDPARSLASVLASMESGHFRHMPVLDGGQIRGIIGAVDILDYLVAKA